MVFKQQSQREQIIAAFDFAKQLAVDALDTRKCTDMWFRLDFGVDRCPKIESNIEEYFYQN